MTGTYTLHTGDCLDVIQSMEAQSVDAIVTDPPYATTGESSSFVSRGKGGIPPETQFFEAWVREHLAEWSRVLKPTGAVWLTIDWRGVCVLDYAAHRLGMSRPKVGVWDRGGLGMGFVLRNTHEVFAVLTMPEWQRRTMNEPDVWRHEWTPGHREFHSAQKPLDLMRRAIRLITGPDAVILDPFAGSFTTGIAALMEGRSFIGIERDPDFVQEGMKRLATIQGATVPGAEQIGLGI